MVITASTIAQKADLDVPSPRVLMLTSNFPRWAGDSTTPFVLHLAQDLMARGWSVDVLAPHTKGAARREVLDGVAVERFRYLLPTSAETVCYGGGALVNLRGNRANLAKVPALVAAEWAAASWRVRRRHYDLVHSHWILPQGFVGAFLPGSTPHVVTIHGGDIFGLRGGAMARAKRYALEHATAVTANSSVTERAAHQLAPGMARCVRIPTGAEVDRPADPELVAELRRAHRRGDGPMLGFVGRIVEEKGYEDFLRAIAALVADCPDVTGLVVGEGQHRAAAEQLAVALGIADRVSFVGWVDPAAVPSHFAAFDVFVAPSRQGPDGWIEAQGLSVIEALAAGTAAVAARCGGIVDTIDDGETGLLVDERAPDQIAKAVLRLRQDPSLAARFAAEGPRVARERFARPASAAVFDALFRSIVDERRAGR